MVIFNSDVNFPEGIRLWCFFSLHFQLILGWPLYQPLEDSLSIKFNMQLPGHGSADTVTRDLNSITFQDWMSWWDGCLIDDSRLKDIQRCWGNSRSTCCWAWYNFDLLDLIWMRQIQVVESEFAQFVLVVYHHFPYGRCHNYRTEVEEYESTVVYLTLLFYNSVFLRRLQKSLLSNTPNFLVIL